MGKGNGLTRTSTSNNPRGLNNTSENGRYTPDELRMVRSLAAQVRDNSADTRMVAIKTIDKAPFKKTDYSYSMDTPFGGADIIDSIDTFGHRNWEVQDIYNYNIDGRTNVKPTGKTLISLSAAKEWARQELIQTYYYIKR